LQRQSDEALFSWIVTVINAAGSGFFGYSSRWRAMETADFTRAAHRKG
jgi:hypothetical protein